MEFAPLRSPLSDDSWSLADLVPVDRREWAVALARALGAAMPAGGETTFAHLALAAPRIVEALRALVDKQTELRLEAGGLVAGFALGPAEEAPGFQTFLDLLGAHGVNAVLVGPRVGAPDVEAFLEGLLQAPETLEAVGGLRGHLERGHIQSIQVWLASVPAGASEHPIQLVREVRQLFQKALAPPDTYSWGAAGWLHYVSDLRGLGPLGVRLGLWGDEPPEEAIRLLRHVLGLLSPDQFFSICRGLGTLPHRPEALSRAFQRAVPHVLPGALRQLLDRGLQWLLLHHPVEDLVGAFPGPLDVLVEPLRLGLEPCAGDPLVQRFLEDLAWRAQNLNRQLEQVQSPEAFLALAPEAQALLMERALKAHRLDALSTLLGHLGDALAPGHPAFAPALEGLRGFLRLKDQHLVPDYVIASLEPLLIDAYAATRDPEARRGLKGLIPEYFTLRLKRGQALGLERAMRVLEVAEGTPEGFQMEGLSVGWLRRAVETDEALDDALACVFQGERTLALNACAPYFACLGESLYHRAAWRLGRESDRQNRDRLLRVLIGAGPIVEEPILRMLRPKMPWYHARNLLVVLGSVGTPKALSRLPSFLDHEDARVRISALRALRFCSGGRIPVAQLIGRLEDPDEILRQEAIHLLATLPGSEALRALSDLAQDRKVALPTRLAAVKGLGATRQAAAAPLLEALANARGGLLSRGEPEVLRQAALEALRQLRGR